MASINATGEALFAGAPDEAWLSLIDERYGNGLEIESLLGGSRSKGARTRTFRAYYLDHGGGRRRGACVVKLGRQEEVMRDYEGWLKFGRRQPRRDSFASMDTPNEADFGAVVVIDFLGTEETPMRSLAEETPTEFPFLAEAVERVVSRVLQPLHECLQSPGEDLPHLTLSQGEVIRNWVGTGKSSVVRQCLTEDPATAETWALDSVRDSDRFVRLPNYIPAVLQRQELPQADMELRLPRGIVHGDSNFDNIFVACNGQPPRLHNVGMIDFEWCSEDPPNSPYDDLARIECELLFGHRVASHRREMTYAVALGDPLMRDGFPLSAGAEPDRELFKAIRAVRLRAAELAELAGARTPDMANAYLRGYLATLFGLAMQYLRYDVPGTGTRSEILHLCQLLAARLATTNADNMPPFSPWLVMHSRNQGSVRSIDDAYVLEASGASTYAGLVTSGPEIEESFLAVCTFEILDAARNGWIAFGVGADPKAPDRTGLAAGIGVGNDTNVRANLVSHADSRHNRRGPILGGLNEMLASPLVVRVARSSLHFEITVEGSGDEPEPSIVRVEVPADQYWGPFALVVHQAAARVTSLKLRVIAPADGRYAAYAESSVLLGRPSGAAFPVATSRNATDPG